MCLTGGSSFAQKKNQEKNQPYFLTPERTKNLSFRSLGPALTSGRISDIVVNPANNDEYYIAAASGGIWKTTNHGTTFNPVFDDQNSYSIGCITTDPHNFNTVWVGTGENNNQRSVGYGDGVYRSLDGGATWKNMGLKTSEHIGKIIVHPTNPNIVFVAAYGPLWSKGGQRGVYKTTDGGKTWENILAISENTGVSDIVIDPKNPSVLYAASHQRRRHVYTYISGGPESAIYKTIDGGSHWQKLRKGLPNEKMGRIGLAISPVNTDLVYAIVEGMYKTGGFYKSIDQGNSWKKMSGYKTSGNYYQEIYCDPIDEKKVFAMDTWLHHTVDGGRTFVKTGENQKHVDNHAIWINPKNTDHWLVGCDGGLYETYDHAKTWGFKSNLPITQFYKVAIDNAEPFYHIYGGTQDNNTIGGPSATINNAGLLNADWFITNGGDGFQPQIDPTDPNTVYAQSQYGYLVRYDKKTGEKIGIKPMPGRNEKAYRWNWDSPLLISPHDHKTLYFCANKVFKTTDQGNSWTTISPDLSKQVDRNKIPVMGRVWSIDAVMKNKSTTIFGNIVAFDESPKQQGLLYVGTDDGLIQVSINDGKTWEKIETFPGLPEGTYVNMIKASEHDSQVVFALFNNHKNGDFKPYLYVSHDRGNTWSSISNNLPSKGSLYTMAQDHINKDLLFVGTEFGVYFSINRGGDWVQIKTGLPTVGVRDMEIQQRENDLVIATFGRGFYVLDNYAALREYSKDNFDQDSYVFQIKDALAFIPSSPLGLRGKSSQGATLFTGVNPKFGAHFQVYLKDGVKTRFDIRKEKEEEIRKKGGNNDYPSLEELRKEQQEQKPFLLFIIKNSDGKEIRRIKKQGISKGITTVSWNLRTASTSPIKLRVQKTSRYGNS